MGSDTLVARTNGQTIDETWFNVIRSILSGDIFARNANGVVESLSGNLGSETYKFLKAHIASGYWKCGDLKIHNTYNGLTGCEIDQGWMLCDGRVIAGSSYDVEHGSGSWNTYIITSPLDGRYLPNYTNRYIVGASATTQTGTSAFTTVGNASHQININHTHTIAHTHTVNHSHMLWQYDENFSNPLDRYRVFDVDGTAQIFNSGVFGATSASATSTTDLGISITTMAAISSAGTARAMVTLYTSKETPTTSEDSTTSTDALSATQSIQPDSIVAQIYMRII